MPVLQIDHVDGPRMKILGKFIAYYFVYDLMRREVGLSNDTCIYNQNFQKYRTWGICKKKPKQKIPTFKCWLLHANIPLENVQNRM